MTLSFPNYFAQKSVRGVDCDVYITQRSDWPPTMSGYNSTWEWYFARVRFLSGSGQNTNKSS